MVESRNQYQFTALFASEFPSTVLFTFDSTFNIVTVLITRDFIQNLIRYYISYLSCSRCLTTLFLRLAALFVESHSRKSDLSVRESVERSRSRVQFCHRPPRRISVTAGL